MTLQAFPVVGEIDEIHDGGMTLLDYFAGQALVGMLARDKYQSYCKSEFARDSYEMAKEMVERKTYVETS